MIPENIYFAVCVQSEITRESARSFCTNYGYDGLVSITSQVENDDLSSLKPLLDGQTWIGLQRVNGVWLWDSGIPFTYNNWSNSQPDNSGDCVEVIDGSNEWNDMQCNSSAVEMFGCEIRQ